MTSTGLTKTEADRLHDIGANNSKIKRIDRYTQTKIVAVESNYFKLLLLESHWRAH